MNAIFNAMVRGFGWSIGRRAANKAPLWLAVALIVGWHFLKGN